MQKEAHNHEGSIRCPKCSHEFPITEGIRSQVRDGLVEEFDAERKKLLSEVESREAGLQQKVDELRDKEQEIAKAVETGIADKLTVIRKEEATKASERLDTEFADLKDQLEENQEALREAKSKELDLRKRHREVEAAKEDLELEVARKLDEERSKIREKAAKDADEENQLRMAEKDKRIQDLSHKIDELKRKAEQGSVQLQGEVLEVDFEQRLRQTFPLDHIEPVSTGARGADISQEVIGRTGRSCGTILVETKRTKAWQDAWTGKLHGDMRTARADIGLIVTETLPKDIDSFGQKDGVWITDFASALPLIHALRATLHEVMIAKGHREGATEKMEMLYEYLTGNEFRQRVQLVIEAFRSMKTELDKERSYLTTKWNKREKQINLVIENMFGMVGDVQALSGGAVGATLLPGGEDADEGEYLNEEDAA